MNRLRPATWRKTLESHSLMRPKFATDFPEPVVREGADELTLRREEGMLRTFMDTTTVGDSAWEPTLVDEDWEWKGELVLQAC